MNSRFVLVKVCSEVSEFFGRSFAGKLYRVDLYRFGGTKRSRMPDCVDQVVRREL